MAINFRRAVVFFAGLIMAASSFGATFGTVTQVRGTVSDIALDERHGKLYIANFTANRIDVMNTSDRTIASSMLVFMPPSSVATSPDNRFLVVGHDNNFDTASNKGGFTIFDLDANTKQEVAIADPVLSVAFGAGTQALVVTTSELLLLDPTTARTTSLQTQSGSTVPLPVPLASTPGTIIQAATGVSADGHVIMVTATTAGANTKPPVPDNVTFVRYVVGASSATILGEQSSPALGPRSIAVDQNGQFFLSGWTLLNASNALLAQFPAVTGALDIGANAWDYSRNRIYSQIPAPGDGAVLHIADTDNLTIRDRIQLPQNLAGRTIFSSDQSTLYAASVSGVTILPVGNLDSSHRLATVQEQLMFQSGVCAVGVISQNLNIVDMGGGSVDFTLSLPDGTTGIRFSQSSGTTPATVRIDVDPTVFSANKGTTTIPLTIKSSGAINLPPAVQLLINTHDVNQHGRIVNIPGRLTDLLADTIRNRVYIIRQDKNLVLVYDTSTFSQIGVMRTGNTPVGMAMTPDRKYLVVGAENSQIASVFDLDTLQPTLPILFPGTDYPHAIAFSNTSSWAVVRSSDGSGKHYIDKIDFASRQANKAASLGIYKNELATYDGVMVASPGSNTIFTALNDGNVLLYDAASDTWVASRQDFKSLGGAYGSFNDSLYIVDNHLLDSAMVSLNDLESTTGLSSGVAQTAGYGLRTTSSSSTSAGTLERIDLFGYTTFHGAMLVESPLTSKQLLTYPPVGQIGQYISTFTRTLAVAADQSSTIMLSQSGLTVIEPTFDSPVTIPSVSGVNNAADNGTDVAPGGLILISGNALAPQSAVAPGVPLPLTLGDVCVAVNNVGLPLFNVSSSQIMAQLPFTVTGKQPLTVRTSAGISTGYSVNIQSFAPAIFHNGSAGDQSGLAAVIRLSNNELVDFTNPIHPDETIAIYLTGMAQTSPAAPLGDAAPSNPLASVTTQPTVTLNGTNLNVVFAGLVPGEVGVYQIDAVVPHGIRDAAQAPLVISQGGASKTLQVRVVNP